MKKIIKFLFLVTLLLAFVAPTRILAQDATNEGESVLQKIKEKVETLRQNPKAYIGTVTGKTENSLQIKDVDGKIQQISVNDGVTIVKTGKTNTEIKFTDVAIGDYIIAMGISTENNVLDAKRILLSSPIEEPKRKIVFGNISEIQGRDITITEAGDSENTYTFPKSWKGPEIKELDTDMRVLIVALTDGNKPTIRTIEIIKTAPPPTPDENTPTPNK
jgi:hypothetical protein